jgi:hypothetical protein
MHENGQPRQGIGALEKGRPQVNRYGAVRQSKCAKVTGEAKNQALRPLDCPPNAHLLSP